MTLRAPAEAPPTVFAAAPPVTATPSRKWAGGGPTTRVRGRPAEEEHPVGGVAEVGGAVDVGADVVARHHVPRRPRFLDEEAGLVVAEVAVPRRGGGPANRVRRRPAGDGHP